MKLLTGEELARYIDHTNLRPDATAQDIRELCAEAKQFSFHSVCVHGDRVELAASLLEDTDINIGSVVGFPLGVTESDVKRFETEAVIDRGAEEIDMVINVGRLRDGNDEFVLRELRDVVEAAEERPVKVILETCLLTREEIVRACHLVLDSGARFVKTSTGFGRSGATLEDVRLMRETVGPEFGVKAAGGIRETEVALAMVTAGANRLGTSAGPAIVQGLNVLNARRP